MLATVDASHREATYHIGLERRLILALQKLAPVDGVEEGVRLDLGRAVGTETLLRVTVEQLGQKVLGGRRYHVVAGEVEGFRENLAVHLVRVLVVEGRQSRKHLVQKDSERPPIHRLVVALSHKQLGRQVLGSTTEGVGAVFVLHVQLAETEIAQGDVALVVEQNVLGLQITVDDVEAVETLESAQKLGRVEPRAVDVEPLLLLQVVEQLTSVDKGQDEVELLGRLEGELEGNDEGVVNLRQH